MKGVPYCSCIILARSMVAPEHCTTFRAAPWARRMSATRPSPVTLATTCTPMRSK